MSDDTMLAIFIGGFVLTTLVSVAIALGAAIHYGWL